MKRITLALLLLVGGASVASADPPGLTPGPDPYQQAPAQQAPEQMGPGAWNGPRGPMAGGPRMQRDGERGRQRRLPPRVRARIMAMFDRNQDGRLEGPERRAARKFVRTVIVRRHLAREGFGPRGAAGRGGGQRGGFGGR